MDTVASKSMELTPLENAMRHGKPEQRSIDYELRVESGRPIVRVVNEVDPRAGGYERLLERVRWVRSLPNPGSAFTRQIENISQGASEGLGLARVVYEGGCELACARLSDGRLEVVASLRPPA